MKTIYTVYQLNEKRNKLGNPYIGFTENLIRRSKVWKRELKLDYIPELIILHTDTSAQRAFDWEQNKRVENGWRRERPLSHLRKISKKGGKSVTRETQIKAGKAGAKAKAKSVATITKEQGEQIKKEYEEMTKKSQRKLARKYVVSKNIIFQIVHETYTNFKD